MAWLNDFAKLAGKGGFPDVPTRVPYPNPHPSGKEGGCFPDPPKRPPAPFPKGPVKHPEKSPTPNRRGS